MHNVIPAEAGLTRQEAQQWRMDTLVGYILQAGVLLSMALVSAGLIWEFARKGRVELDYQLHRMNLFGFVVGEFRRTFARPAGPHLLVNAGIIVLMLTPFFRVFASVLYFLLVEKNRKYTLFTLVVLTVLTYSLFLR